MLPEGKKMSDEAKGGAGAPQPPGEVTRLLAEWSHGDRDALERLIPLVYGELRALAARYLSRERQAHTLQPTALVHEAYLKLVDQRGASFRNRAHFFAVAAQAMRRILVDHARTRGREKRGGGQPALAIEDSLLFTQPFNVDLIALENALGKLGTLDGEQAKVVELRFFGGLTVDETAEVLGASPSTVKRDWQSARAFLYRELSAAPV
jgi:RNA polymerase sigma factor (TIGR02999 family)